MKDFIAQFTNPWFYIDYCLVLFVVISILIIAFKTFKKRTVWYYFLIISIVFLVAAFLGLQTLVIIASIVLACSIVIFCFVNIGDVRPFFLNPIKKSKKEKAKLEFNKENFYKTINETILNLSKSKTGAIITFERKNSLDEYIKSGTLINAPVSKELLETIFFEGTRLHDGAVIVRGNEIIAASVYYPPTNRALMGKYGARHRAALGIAEVTDSITIVVSEETGRISLAYNGMMEACSLDSFYQSFVDLMNE